MLGNWAGLITRSCITRELAGELSTFQMASQSFLWVFLVVLLQTAPGNIVPNSHIRGWCSHCVFKSHSELKKHFSSKDLSETLSQACPKALLSHNVPESSLHVDRRVVRWETTVLFHRPQGQCWTVLVFAMVAATWTSGLGKEKVSVQGEFGLCNHPWCT